MFDSSADPPGPIGLNIRLLALPPRSILVAAIAGIAAMGHSATPRRLRRHAAPPLCLSEIKSGHIRDAIRRGPGGKEYALPSLRCAIGEHPCPKPSACASRYSSERKISESGVDVPRLR